MVTYTYEEIFLKMPETFWVPTWHGFFPYDGYHLFCRHVVALTFGHIYKFFIVTSNLYSVHNKYLSLILISLSRVPWWDPGWHYHAAWRTKLDSCSGLKMTLDWELTAISLVMNDTRWLGVMKKVLLFLTY